MQFKIGDIVELPMYHKGIHWKVKSIQKEILYVAPTAKYSSFSPDSSYSTRSSECVMIKRKETRNIPWL